ncbi:hypothetical protein BKA65DRAFT_518896 [Rhexocercosporidium sp. MPI-PUGE-AT-0058]|nr:hypothetical protein BKA65DRAFT_518896 [Rhexocercosporidium sp. MPI-PUGE-AT-0058]
MGTETPLVNDSTGPHALLIVTLPLALALLCFSARIYTRAFPIYKLNASDYMNSFAIFSELVTFSLFAASINAGFGRHDVFITPQMHIKIMKLKLASVIAGPFASTFARVSTVYQMVTIAPSVAWRRSLWAMVGFLLAAFVAFDLSAALQCHPINWATSGHCFSKSARLIINYTRAGTGIINDLAFAIVPTFLIWKLSRSRWELCLVSTLMSFGLCATGMGIGYIIQSRAIRMSAEPMRSSVVLFMYCRLEEIFLLIAASAPFLKAPIERVLRRFGAPAFHNMPRELATYHSNGASGSQESDARPRQGLGGQKTQSDGSLSATQTV